MPIANYRFLALGRQLGIGVAGAQYVALSAVAKGNGPAAPYCIPNELVCAEIARFIRLPVPPMCVVTAVGQPPKVASLDFNLTGNSLPPVNVTECVRQLPRLSTGLLLFDIWVANCDRHPENFSVDFLSAPPQMNVFDHSHALFGYAVGAGQARLTALQDRLGISWTTNNGVDSGRHRHCLLDVVGSDNEFEFWINRIRSVPDFFIEEVCRDAQPYGLTAQETSSAIQFLTIRRNNLHAIIQTNRAEFTAINNWSVLP